MILVNFIPSSEVVRTRWWVYDLALAATLLVGGFFLTAYMLGVNHSQVEAITLRSKKLAQTLGEKSNVFTLVGARNKQLQALGLTSEKIFAEDADTRTKAQLPFVTQQLLTKLPAGMWLTHLEAKATVRGRREWQLAGGAFAYSSIARFLGSLANDSTLRQTLAKAGLALSDLKLSQLELAKSPEGDTATIVYAITLVTKEQNRRYAERQDIQPTDHRL